MVGEAIIKLTTTNMGQKHKHGVGNPTAAEDRPGEIRQMKKQTDLIAA